MLHFNTSWGENNTSFFHSWCTLAGTIYYIYFCHLLTSNFMHSSSILYIFRLHWPILFPFSIKLCHKINTTHDVTLSGTFAISISSKLKLFKTEEYIFSEKKYETLKQMKMEIFWSETLFLEFKSYGKNPLYSILSNASPIATVEFEEQCYIT